MRVIGVGASAGGLEALNALFEQLPVGRGHAWVVVQHLARDHKSLMADILAKRTTLPVSEARDGQPIEPDHIYLGPAHANVVVQGGVLRLVDRAEGHGINLPIDELFRSMAAEYGNAAVAVVLSGTGSDGREGVTAVKEAGGAVVVQEPNSARFDGMPLAAMSTGLVDAVLPATHIAEEVLRLADHEPRAPQVDPVILNQLLAVLKSGSGIDFSEYKISTVLRRIDRRLHMLELASVEAYLDVVRVDRGEAKRLADDLLINVTRFFRDPPAWKALEQHVLSQLGGGREPVRVWVPGCATGPEAYTVAMLLAQHLPPDREFKVFGTDIDSVALQVAAAGRYGAAELLEVPEALRDRFFTKSGDEFLVDAGLRRHLLFASHNLAKDPPFTKLDLITCRNVLIYFAPELQHRVLRGFGFALKANGALMLGPSESLGDLRESFATIDGQWKVFRRELTSRAFAPPSDSLRLATTPRPPPVSSEQMAIEAGFRLLTERVAPSAVLVTESLELVSVYGNAARLLSMPVGNPSLSLPRLLPPSLQTVVSLATHRALSGNEELRLAVADPAGTGVAAIRAVPVSVPGSSRRFAALTFESSISSTTTTVVDGTDASEVVELRRQLQTVRDSLQATIEELETSNEELQSTNEELMAANEELQATNEELQSLNEELNTVNSEHRARIDELTKANEDLDNVFSASPISVLFLDESMSVRRFTNSLTSIFPLLKHDIGRPISHLAPAVADPHFLTDVQEALRRGTTIEREVGSGPKRQLMRVAPYLTTERLIRGVVVSFIDITATFAVRRLQAVLDSLQQSVALLDPAGVVAMVNTPWTQFGLANGMPAETEAAGVGADYLAACRGEPEVAAQLQQVLSGQRQAFTHEYPCHSPTEKRWFLMHCSRLRDGTGAVVSHLDITHRKRLEVLT